MSLRKAQVQVVSLVLVSGIIISLIGFAYMFGMPLIEKRSTITQYVSAVKFMEDLDRKIVDIARTCREVGGCEDRIEAPIRGLIYLNASTNSITYEFPISQPLVTRDKILINTINPDTRYAAYGETPGVITMEGVSEGSVYRLRFNLLYRELYNDDQEKSYKINLTASERGDSGTTSLIIFYNGFQEVPGGSLYRGYDLVYSKIGMNIL